MNEVSIVIVSWNARTFLRDCLNSIYESPDPVVREVIVVDNNSADGSPEMVRSEFPQVELIGCQENLGFAKANNLALERASGSYLALINSDIVVHPGCLKKLANCLEQNETVGLVGPQLYGSDGDAQQTFRKFPTLWRALCRTFALDTTFARWPLFSGMELRPSESGLLEADVLSGCFWLARRTAVQEIGVLDERFFFYAEDVDWCKRFWDGGWRVVFLPEATAVHFGGASSARAELQYSVELIRSNLLYWRKHFGVTGQMAFYFVSVIHHSFRFLAQGIRTLISKDPSADVSFKCSRSFACLRWLLTGR